MNYSLNSFKFSTMLLLTGQVPMTSQVKPLYQTLPNCEALVTVWSSEIHFILWANFILFISQLKSNLVPLFFSLQILKIEVILLLFSWLNFNYFKNIWIFFLLNLLHSCSMCVCVCVCTYIHAGSFFTSQICKQSSSLV